MERSVNQFPYKHLKEYASELRILHLLPGLSINDGFRCELEHVDLNRKPTYHALSYS